MSSEAVILSEQSLAEALPAGVVVLNKDGQMLWWNSSASRFLGLMKHVHAQQQLADIIGRPDFTKQFKSKTPTDLEIMSPHTPNMRLAITVSSYHHGQFLVMIENVTQRYQLEQIRQDFVANVSHELRTPLTVIRGYLELLLDMEQPQQATKHMIAQMFEQSLRMEKLVQDLLLLSRLESRSLGSDDQSPVAILPLLSKICEQARTLSGTRDHEITIDGSDSCCLLGNEDELHSAFSNLVFNAVNYTPANGSIKVSYHLDDDGLHVKVTDTGIGIAAVHIPRLTERFYRVDKARSRGDGGTGLGLAIVKHVLIRHNAILNILSKPGKGSTFDCVFAKDKVVNECATTDGGN